MSVAAIIVAAGRGARLGGPVPKQLLDVGGRSILQRSVAAFDSHAAVSQLIVVLPSTHLAEGPSLVGVTARPLAIVAGGDRRQDSVRAGLAALSEGPTIVLVHDAARPFVTHDVIDRVIDAARTDGAALPALQARDTVKHVDRAHHFVRATIPRDEIWLAQTPQGFRREVLVAAMARSDEIEATDEAMLAERTGHAVRVVAGDERNMKITTFDDLTEARSRLAPVSRVGTGYDLHRLVSGRPLVLAGVTIPFELGPLGHSDGDVVCHAITDAVLGAAAAGDIGQHFSNTDPRWKDAPGLDLLERALDVVAERGLRVQSVDVTVILERPKLAPFATEIRSRLASVLGCGLDHVSVKGKTNEGVDAVGRGEAIAAHAVAVLGPGGRS